MAERVQQNRPPIKFLNEVYLDKSKDVLPTSELHASNSISDSSSVL